MTQTRWFKASAVGGARHANVQRARAAQMSASDRRRVTQASGSTPVHAAWPQSPPEHSSSEEDARRDEAFRALFEVGRLADLRPSARRQHDSIRASQPSTPSIAHSSRARCALDRRYASRSFSASRKGSMWMRDHVRSRASSLACESARRCHGGGAREDSSPSTQRCRTLCGACRRTAQSRDLAPTCTSRTRRRA